jgi:Zinc dependent phospholipase C
MPGPILHRELAFRLLEAEPFRKRSPFPLDDRGARHAFFAGSLGPDVGVFPGGSMFVSDLAHYVRTADLCRALVARARTAEEKAYAWGWVAHVLADRILHPLVNRGVGFRKTGDAEREIAYAEDPAAHVQVELGLDAHWLLAAPRAAQLGPEERDDLRRLAESSLAPDAYLETYGIPLREELARSQRALGRWLPSWFRIARWHSSRSGWQSASRWKAALAALCLGPGRLLTSFGSRQAAGWGLFRATPPPPWMRIQCADGMRRFEGAYLQELENGSPAFANGNLDTGRNDGDVAADYPPAVRTQAALERRLGDSFRIPVSDLAPSPPGFAGGEGRGEGG